MPGMQGSRPERESLDSRLESEGRRTVSDIIPDPNSLFDFAGVARCWGLAESEQRELLGGVDVATFERWRLGGVEGLDAAVSQRLSLIFEIFQLLQSAYHDPVEADGWVRKPNAALHGAQPLTLMMESADGVTRVRDHLQDAVAAGRAA